MPAIMTLGAGLALSGPAYCGLFLSNVPSRLCPFPLLTVLPPFLLADIGKPFYYAAVLIPPILFLLWQPALFDGSTEVLRRTYVFLVLVTVLNSWQMIGGWRFGVKYEGLDYTSFVCAASGTWNFLVLLAFGVLRKWKASFHFNVLANWLLFAWLAWYAFPWLGELP